MYLSFYSTLVTILLVVQTNISFATEERSPPKKSADDYRGLCTDGFNIDDLTTAYAARITLAMNLIYVPSCLDQLRGGSENLDEDRAAALNCFKNPAIERVFVDKPVLDTHGCHRWLYEACVEDRECKFSEEGIFGSKECGYLGEYLDYLRRVKGARGSIFTHQDGVTYCQFLRPKDQN